MTFLESALDPPFADDEIRMVTLPAPRAAPEAVLRFEPRSPAFFWSAQDALTFGGSGAAAVVRAAGPDRARAVGRSADGLWARIRCVAHPDTAPLPPRLLGGFSFLPGRPTGPWEPFGEATFVLPRLTYAVDDAGARLGVAATGAEIRAGGADRVLASASAALHLLDGAGRPGGTSARAGAVPRPDGNGGRDEVGSAEWHRAIASIQRLIAAGRAEKIVAARAREVRFEAPVDPVEVVRELRAVPAEIRFAFRFDGATFIGATPERLVSRRGLEIRTEALAGSADPDRHGREPAILSNEKDAAEHRLVVRAIAAALEPVCTRLDYPERPAVRRLRHVVHLRTPFEGTLASPVPILELVARLHPTPAVGGAPTQEALAWIEREEGLNRGWYAAPVGWFDAAGDGDFAVALRSALLIGDRALLFAGAGIVAASDPAAELAETELKLRTMLDALGVAGDAR
jgi:isochorismate synthase